MKRLAARKRNGEGKKQAKAYKKAVFHSPRALTIQTRGGGGANLGGHPRKAPRTWRRRRR
jgi:hypothetical protein